MSDTHKSNTMSHKWLLMVFLVMFGVSVLRCNDGIRHCTSAIMEFPANYL